MNTKHTNRILILIVLAGLLFLVLTTPADASADYPNPIQWWERSAAEPEVTAMLPLWWQLCNCKYGGCQQAPGHKAQPAAQPEPDQPAPDMADPEPTPAPEPEPTPDCGGWSESGPHPCPGGENGSAADMADPTPEPKRNGK